MELPECEDAVLTALQQRRPRHIVDLINKFLVEQYNDDKSSVRAIDFVCLDCRDNGPEGNARAFFSAPPPTIVFCANRLHSTQEVEETMVHELIHAYDFTVRKMDITKSDLLACSEIRSARESECYHRAKLLATLLPDVKYFREITQWLNTRCVREHAIRSTSVKHFKIVRTFESSSRSKSLCFYYSPCSLPKPEIKLTRCSGNATQITVHLQKTDLKCSVLSATYTLQNTDGYDFTEQRAQLRRIQNVYVRVDNSSFLNRNTLLELQTMITESKNLSSRFDMYIQCN